MEKIIALIFLAFFGLDMDAKNPPDDLVGSEFRTWVKQNYYDGGIHQPLDYSTARKKMFAYIANDNDSIECIYSGLRQPHAYGFEISFPEPFNTEHVVPQSLFNSNEPMRSDIHILQPAFQDWNSLRSNFDFMELNDQTDTEQWIYLNQSTTSIPSQNIERYSEFMPFGWEPREESKGNIARACMYFFTMYPQYVISSTIDTSVLCQWHEEDEVDAMELFRSETTSEYQGSINPYINFPSWANQAWGCNVEVIIINQAPVADDETAATSEGMPVNIDVITGDVDDQNDLDTASITIIDSTDHGVVTVLGDGTVTYVPDPGFNGTDVFQYVICDNGEPVLCDTAEVVITVDLVNNLVLLQPSIINIYPNPGNGRFHIEINSSMGFPLTAELIDLQGKVNSIETIDSSTEILEFGAAQGIYYLVIKSRLGETIGYTPIGINR